jgi:hypothetical protein
LRFDARDLTSFAGVVIFMALFRALVLKKRLKACFGHLKKAGAYGYHTILMLLVVHKLLGFRQLREVDYYRDDPLLKQLLALRRIPDVATISRNLKNMDSRSFEKILKLIRHIVYQRLVVVGFSTVTIDFDGTVIWTKGSGVEGTAVGFCPKKKGARSYYPLLATISQTGQVLNMLHRPGNVHDSNGAIGFVVGNIEEMKERMPQARIECRFDSAFFDEVLLLALQAMGVEFSITVPFERFPELKKIITDRKRWRKLNKIWSYFEDRDWHPKKWERGGFRFIFARQRVVVQRKGPIQLDLFIPKDFKFEYKVFVTNKKTRAKNVLEYHNGRGSQEGIIGELKSGAHFDYIPCRSQAANQHFMAAALLAHNLGRELQMAAEPPQRGLTAKRAAGWVFRKLTSLRHMLVRAGRLGKPGNELTLTMSDNESVRREIEMYLEALAT